jgi:hypothetical protein
MPFASDGRQFIVPPGGMAQDALAPHRQQQALDGLNEVRQHIGRALRMPAEDLVLVDHFLARRSELSVGDTDFGDARYYVDRCIPSPGLVTDDALTVTDDLLHPYPRNRIAATNLAEAADGTHNLAYDRNPIHVFGVQVLATDVAGEGESATPGLVVLYFFDRPVAVAQIIARVSGEPTRDGTKCRWTYPIIEVAKTTAGYGGWTDKSGGVTGTAYHLSEDQNDATGTMGNGAELPDATATVDLVPVPEGTRVRVWPVLLPDGTKEYWFDSPTNGVSVECP